MTRTDKLHMTFTCLHLTVLLACLLFTACDDTENAKVYLGGETNGDDMQTSGHQMMAGSSITAGSTAGSTAGDESGGMNAGHSIDLVKGEDLYQQFCGFCHGSDGTGYLADNANALSNQDFLSVATDDFLTLSTVHGRPGTPMSPWGVEKGGPLDEGMVSNIVAFIRTWQTEPSLTHPAPTLAGNPQRGRPLYNAVCASCHGTDGEGVSAVSLNNPWFLNTVEDGFIAHAIQVGRRGTAMGAYGPPLVNQQGLADLVALIRSWERPVDTDPPPPFTPQIDETPLNPEGSEPAFELREGRFVPAQQVHDALLDHQKMTIIDARPIADYLDEHIDGAISLPFYEIGNYAEQLDPNVFTITYCGCPHAVSGQAADALIALGFPKVAILDEGFYEWRDTFGFPTMTGEHPRALSEDE